MITVSTDYSGRLVDLEFLQSITSINDVTAVSKSIALQQPKMVTGMQKLLQRYTTILLTTLGGVHLMPDQGTRFLSQVLRGGGRSRGHILQTFAFANVDVIEQLRREDNATDLFGQQEPDEMIGIANLIDYTVDTGKGILSLVIYIENKVGETFNYVLPVPIPRS